MHGFDGLSGWVLFRLCLLAQASVMESDSSSGDPLESALGVFAQEDPNRTQNKIHWRKRKVRNVARKSKATRKAVGNVAKRLVLDCVFDLLVDKNLCVGCLHVSV